MAQDKSIDQLDAASAVNSDAEFALVQTVNGNKKTLKSSISQISEKVIADYGTWLSATLSAGSTSVTFTDASIGANSIIDVYTSVGNVVYTGISVSGTSCTVTFPAQSSAITVSIWVR